MARTQIRLREPSGTSAVNRTGKKRAAAEDAAKKIKHQARKGRSRRQTQQRHSPGPDQCPPLSAVLKMPQFDALEVLKAGEDNEELAETLRANDCVFVVHEGIDLDASVIDPHEYWKMQIVSLHKDRATGKKWVVGAWFYTPSQLEGVKLTDKDRSIIKRMGNAELVLSTHKDVIDPLCIQSKLTVHFFDDNDALTRPIKQSSWFHRFILTWRGSAQPTKDYGVLKNVNRHCTCDEVYSPVLDEQRYCKTCAVWYHPTCIGMPFRTKRMSGPLEHMIRMAPVVRGALPSPPGDWMIAGSARLINKARRLRRDSVTVSDWKSVVGESFVSYISLSGPKFYSSEMG
ncbi:hypothetical protein BDZ97DRAFT_1925117 [Flammula alnicola]|nr:hypothetical protein BDZ97DRAFT_1925117 [Flammula alnicola]